MKRMSFLIIVVVLAFAAFSCEDSKVGTRLDDDATDGDLPGLCGCDYGCDPEGSCLPPTCDSDIDCPAGMICHEGRCTDNVDPVDGDNGDIDGDETTDGDEDVIQTDGDGSDNPTDGDYDFDIEFETDVPHEEDDPWITVDPRELDFGAVPIATSRIKTITIKNIGKGDLEVDNIYFYFEQTAGEELYIHHPSLPLVLVESGEATVDVEFIPTDVEPDTNLLIIHSNDPSEPNVGVDIITDIKEQATATVDPLLIDFGIVRLGNYSQQVEISNDSGVELLINSISLDSQSPEITMDGVPDDIDITNPMIMEHHDRFAFDIKYVPTLADGTPDTAMLVIETSDETNGTFNIPITGTPCEPEIDTVPTVIDFTDVEFGTEETRCATIFNIGCWDLNVSRIELVDDGDGAYSWDPEPDASLVMEGQDSLDLCVKYTPQSTGDGMGMIEVASDDETEPLVEILLTSTIVPPDIDCQPIPLDFGRVPLEQTETRQVECRNLSPGQLVIERYEIDRNPEDRFELVNVPQTVLELNESTVFEVSFVSDAENSYEGNLLIQSNDPDEIKLDVPLIAESYDPNNCPVAEIRLVSPPADQILVGGVVQLDGSGSHDPDNGDSINRYIWSLPVKPSGSNTLIQGANDPQPSIAVDKPGDYQVKLQVKDTFGEPSCEDAWFSFTAATPPADIECTPMAVDFGSREIPSITGRTLNCRNVGGLPLNISQWEIVSPTPGMFSIVGSGPSRLDPGPPSPVNLSFKLLPGDSEGSYAGAIKIHSDDPDEPILEIPLAGGAYEVNRCPTAVAEITSPPLGSIKQFDTVQLDGTGSYDNDSGDSISKYIWTVQSAPGGSTSQIVNPNDAQPTFYVDLPGTYIIALEVKDIYNQSSCSIDTVQFTSVQPGDIECGPNPLDFGSFLLGGSQTKTVTCRNVGGLPINISSIELLAGSAVDYTISSVPSTPFSLGVFSTTQIEITYEPMVAATHMGTLGVHSDDPDEPLFEVDLTGNAFPANNCPTAQINVVGPNLNTLKPLDTIYFDGSLSSDPDAGDSIASYQWTIINRPAGSTENIRNANAVNPTFFVDLAGNYTVQLEVRDQQGMPSCQPDTVSFEAIPRERIHVQLVWNTDETDFDLHLVRPGGSLWTASACYFSNCTNGLNWSSYGVPSLDIDRRYGYGPENINLDDPGNGTYQIYVHYWDDHGITSNTTVTVRVYIWGVLAGEWQNVFTYGNLHDRWPVANLTWNTSTDNGTLQYLGQSIESDGHGSRRVTGGPEKPPIEF